MAVAGGSRSMLGVFWDELQPYPGRLGMSLQTSVLCMAVVITAMALEVPEAALSCYLLFFAARDNAGEGILIAVALIGGATLGIALGVVFLAFSADEPMLRIALMILFTFGGMFFSRASQAGEVAGTVGFVFAFVVSLDGLVPTPELLIRALAWMWVVVFFPMLYLVIANIVAGRNPATMARQVVVDRLQAVAALLASPSAETRGRVVELLGEGSAGARKYLDVARLLSFAPKAEMQRTAELVDRSYRLMVVAEATYANDDMDAVTAVERAALAQACHRLAAQAGRSPRPGSVPSFTVGPAARTDREADDVAALIDDVGSVLTSARPPQAAPRPDIAHLIGEVSEILSPEREPKPALKPGAEPMLAPDAFTNPEYVQFALKTTLAVMICYIFYTALDWFAIHTAMITCFYVALGSTGETVHKLTLRIIGCLMGGALGALTIIFLMPHMVEIGQLAVVVGVVAFVAAWIANGSERISYMGWQLALAFFLCTINSFGPAYDLDEARDRIIGILVGNVVMFVVFSTIWPVSVMATIRSSLVACSQALANIAGPAASPANRLLDYERLHTALAASRRYHRYLAFEPAANRRQRAELAEMDNALAGIAEMAAPVTLIAEHGDASDSLRSAPHPLKKTLDAFRTSVAGYLASLAARLHQGDDETLLPAWRHSPEHAQAVWARTRRRALDDGQRLPVALQADITGRLELYRKLDRRMANHAPQRGGRR
ncbi:FUSC family protein [Aminobacter sp. HY435]|uniref:FUSC family protein n=1 Tax=Aminobacter sp. HY435 TaxID=2970917 RepID=UPI0022B9B699|nr:FUSC family protein [Aminobacter sp. HY435]